jgi:hypothetical protein
MLKLKTMLKRYFVNFLFVFSVIIFVNFSLAEKNNPELENQSMFKPELNIDIEQKVNFSQPLLTTKEIKSVNSYQQITAKSNEPRSFSLSRTIVIVDKLNYKVDEATRLRLMKIEPDELRNTNIEIQIINNFLNIILGEIRHINNFKNLDLNF